VRKLFVPVLVAMLLGPAAASAEAVTKRVIVGDNFFVRPEGVPTVRVKKGTRVKWVWTGMVAHGVTTLSGPSQFFSNIMIQGTYSKKMRRKGRYTLICPVHGQEDQSMRLVVR
jgi:plastocyanin